MSERVVVRIKDGKANVDLQGFNGVGCGELAAKLATNGKVVSEETKPEFYNTVAVDQTVTS